MTKPLASILICNYNYGRFLREAIDSALNQTYPNVEVVVVDDGSTDDSIEIAESYGNRIVFLAQTNQGQRTAFGNGFDRSTGDIVLALDSDDRCHPHRVERVVAAFEADPAIVQVCHQRQTIDEDGNPLQSRNVRISSGDVTPALFRWARYQWGVTSTLAYRRDALAVLLPIEPVADIIWIDTNATIGAAFLGPVAGINERLVDYRVHGNNMQSALSPKQLIRQRRGTVELINWYAAANGDQRRVTPDADNELTALRSMTDNPASVWRRLVGLARTLHESIDLRRAPIDSGLTLFSRAVISFAPSQAERLIGDGPGRYLRSVLRR